MDTVAVVEVEENRNDSPKSERRIANSTPNHTYTNNVTVITSTPKVNGYPISPISEINSPELSLYKTLRGLEDPTKGPGSADTLDGEVKKKRSAADKAYFIAKEFLMTERTYIKDLDVINLWLRDEFDKAEEKCITQLLRIIDPLHDVHCLLLKEIESRLQSWEIRGANHHRIADILLSATQNYSLYEDYLHEHQDVLVQLSKDLCSDTFEQIYTGFEKNKVCYLPLTLFILKPIQRLLHYAHLIERLKKHYGPEHPDYAECEDAGKSLEKLVKQVPEILNTSENYVQLIELGRDISGFEGTLTEGDRHFIRQGCLGKFSQRKGFQQRMFFLLSDMVLYSKLSGQSFKVHGQMPVKSLTVEERVDNPSPNSFIIYSGTRAITVSAATQEEKDKWLEDLTCAIDRAKNSTLKTSLLSLKCSSSSDDVTEKSPGEEIVRASPQRSNTTVHVCWHRNTSISLKDQIRAAENQLSGYLLRKFKNSNGWQKLWVVFTNFCLFFYKTFQDDAPLASLPLLGYSVTAPTENDNINKDYVFKLQFKNHVYFFRAESEYTYSRWMEVIGSATLHSGRTRLFSRKESSLDNIS